MANVDQNPPDPTSADPFVPGSPPTRNAQEAPLSKGEQMGKRDPRGDDGPSYERHQDPEDTTGGSTDPHNSLGHEDSGNETVSTSE